MTTSDLGAPPPGDTRARDVRPRARPMSPDDRRAMIAEASIPLFIEFGPSLTTRQIAESLDIAEGTLFRAFGDKDALVQATVRAFFERAGRELPTGLIDASLSIEAKVSLLVRNVRIHMSGLFAMMALIDPHSLHEFIDPERGREFDAAVAAAFAADADRLGVDPRRVGSLVRAAAIAAWAPPLHEEQRLDEDELTHFILYGIAGQARGKD